jgi:hypothetical protein
MNDKNTAAKAAPKADAMKVGTNVLALPWPRDPQGYLKTIKEGTRAAERVNGDPARLTDFLKSLDILSAYAKETYVRDLEKRHKARANAVSARVRVAEKQARQAEAKAQEYEAAAVRVRKQGGVPVAKTED